jgi:hypothetical protein
MTQQMNTTLQTWLDAIDQYSDDQFAAKPNDSAWSVGQVYEHLVTGTNRFFIAKINECLNDPQNEEERPTEMAQGVLATGSLPPIKIKGNPNAPQPVQPTTQEMKIRLHELRTQLAELGQKVVSTDSKGRAGHPTFGFMDAKEWFQYSEMHFRHHLRQKEALNTWLAGGEYV